MPAPLPSDATDLALIVKYYMEKIFSKDLLLRMTNEWSTQPTEDDTAGVIYFKDFMMLETAIHGGDQSFNNIFSFNQLL